MAGYPPHLVEDAALFASANGMQEPATMISCTGTKASTRDCFNNRMSQVCQELQSQKGGAYFTTFNPSYYDGSPEQQENPYISSSNAGLLFQRWCQDDPSRMIKTKAGMAALCYERLQAELADPNSDLDCDVTQCYCKDFVFPTLEETFDFSDDTTDTTETATDPADPKKTLQSNVTVDNASVTDTSIYAYGTTIPQLFGSVVVGGTILWIDTPYRVPYIEYVMPVYQEDESGNLNGTTEIKKRYSVRTNILVAVGVKTDKDVIIKSIKIGDRYIPVANAEVVTDVLTHVHNGDFNALRYTPAYRDLTVIRITDVPVLSFTDIAVELAIDATVDSLVPLQTTSVIPLTSNIVRAVNNTYQYYLSGEILSVAAQYPNTINTISHTLPAEVTFEPSWWTTDREYVVYHFAGEVIRYNTLTGERTVITSVAATPHIAYLTQTNTIVYFISNTVYNNGITSTYVGSVDKVFPNGWFADLFDFAANTVLRVIAEEYTVSQFSLIAGNILDVAQSTKYYLVFCDTGLYVYKRSDLSFVKHLPYSIVSMPELPVKEFAGTVYALHLGNKIVVFDIDRSTVTEKTCQTIDADKQIYYASMLSVISSNGTVSTYSTHSQDAVTTEVNVGDFLTTLGYPYPSGFDLDMHGYAVTRVTAAVEDVTTLYSLPHSNIQDAVAIDAYEADIVVKHKSEFYDAVKLTYLRGDRYSGASASASVTYAGDSGTVLNVANVNSAAFLTTQQANEIASNLYANMQAVATTLEIVSKELMLEVGDVIAYQNQMFRVTEFIVDGYSKYTAVGMDVNYVPYVDTTTLTPPTVYTAWDFTGTTLVFIPMALSKTFTHNVGYIGEKPNLILVEGETRTGMTAADPVTTIGALVNPPTFRLQRRIIDRISEVTVQFNAAQNDLAAADLEALIADPYLNLLIVGNEAMQFTSFSTADNKLVTFTGLLRGRFNTEFFENYHALNERVFIYKPSEWTAYSPIKSGHTVLTSTTDSGTYVYNWQGEYSGTVNVKNIYFDDAGLNIHVDGGQKLRTRVSFATKPIIWQTTTDFLMSVVVNSDYIETYDVPQHLARHQYVYWMAEADGFFPEYGVLGKPVVFMAGRVYNTITYAVVAPRETIANRKQIGYAVLW